MAAVVLLSSSFGVLAADAAPPPSEFADFDAPARRAQLERGEVVVIADDAAARTGSGLVRAAVRIRAAPELVFAQMIDCTEALRYVPHMRRCKVLASAPDRSSQDVEHDVDYGWLLPAVVYQFRARYVRNRSVDFERLGGDLRVIEGRWELQTDDGGHSTLVRYRVQIAPRFSVPQWLIRSTLRRELPELLGALRKHCEQRTLPPSADIPQRPS